jgi:hypothetical protein
MKNIVIFLIFIFQTNSYSQPCNFSSRAMCDWHTINPYNILLFEVRIDSNSLKQIFDSIYQVEYANRVLNYGESIVFSIDTLNENEEIFGLNESAVSVSIGGNFLTDSTICFWKNNFIVGVFNHQEHQIIVTCNPGLFNNFFTFIGQKQPVLVMPSKQVLQKISISKFIEFVVLFGSIPSISFIFDGENCFDYFKLGK